VPICAVTAGICFARLRVENTGSFAWPVSNAGPTFLLRPVLIADSGHEVPSTPVWDHHIGSSDLPPGHSAPVVLPFQAPDSPGYYALHVRLIRRFPGGEVIADEVSTPTGSSLVVFGTLRVSDLGL
jgi:hypothetical protein